MNQASPQSAKRLSVLDATFLRLESREMPMHVASLQIHSLPPGAPAVIEGVSLNVGVTGSRDSLPHLQKMAVYAGEALDELEAVFTKLSENAP